MSGSSLRQRLHTVAQTAGSLIAAAWLAAFLALALNASAAEPAAVAPTFTLATFNLENYLLSNSSTRKAKPDSARTAAVRHLASTRADIVALQEVGGLPALEDLKSRLARAGLPLPHHDLIHAWDTNIQIAVLSRYPIAARHPHTNEPFVLDGRRRRVSRGFLDVELQVSPRYRLRLITAHLKSQRIVPEADQAELRLKEAERLRRLIDDILAANQRVNLLVCGDLNDHPASAPIQQILGKGRFALIDARPGEGAPGSPAPRALPSASRRVTWTHFYGIEDAYNRFDYILMSRGLAREWQAAESYVLAMPDWGDASDHRPVVARFEAIDR